jgi:UDP-N-acetylmuramoyl-L-alanyl-D-glutamate--2,6-diaminopimelate ligase
MQRVAGPRASSQASVIVDYAHTPDGLRKALAAARAHCRGRLHLVFGCGGDRDARKRPIMGGIAASGADAVTVTDDNPRSEDPANIVHDILAGIHDAQSIVRVEHDRALAIRTAIEAAAADDLVLIAGKGHEDYQIYGATRRPFSDEQVARAVLEALP